MQQYVRYLLNFWAESWPDQARPLAAKRACFFYALASGNGSNFEVDFFYFQAQHHKKNKGFFRNFLILVKYSAFVKYSLNMLPKRMQTAGQQPTEIPAR